MHETIALPVKDQNPMKRVLSIRDFLLPLFIGAGSLLLICAGYLAIPKVGILLSTQLIDGQMDD
jgi:hypothetical protein